MNAKDFRRHEWHYSADENGMETRAVAMYSDGLACVLQIVRDEEGLFYYGVFADYCKEQTVKDRDAFLRFICDNCDNGYSCGSFETLKELNEQMVKDGVTGYGTISEF